MFKRICLFILALSLQLSTQAQILFKGLGDQTALTKINNGILIQTNNGMARVLVYSPSTFRISITKNQQFDDFSYAVITNANGNAFKMNEQATRTEITTDSCKLIISKNPVRFQLFNHKNELLNEDEPAFGTAWIGEDVTTYKKLQEGERFIGLGEKTGNLDRRGEGYTNWNTDYFGYPSNGDPLYATIPFFIGIHHQRTYGIFMDNTSKSHFNFGASNERFSSFTAEEGDMNYYLIGNSTVAGIIQSYTDLTGRIEMPSLWSIGFQQCRYSYYPESEVLTLAKTFRDKKIPADVLYFDIHYMDQYKIFTWNNERFPDPKRMLNQLGQMGFKNVVIVDPGIKVEKSYQSYEQGVQQNLFMKYPDGTDFIASVWPGRCHFPDFTNEKTRLWWGNSFKGYVNDGIDGFWNDMNEPASWGQKYPDLVQAYYEGQKANHRKWHNIYGMQMARATYEGTKKLLNNKRPLILTRAAYAGTQRYSAIWTGDNLSNDESILTGVRLVNSLGLSGMANAGYDVGGFAGECSPATFARWISIGAFCPFYRNHKMIDAKDSEPWSYGEKVEEISRNYISLRYKLMPYLYSAFYEASQTGMPVARSLAINYTHDPLIYDWKYQNQYLFGNGIMVAPVVGSTQITKVYLPKGSDWYDLYNEEKLAGGNEIYVETPLEKLPTYVKGSSIIPMQSLVQHADEKPSDTLYIHLYKGTENNHFTYYEDAGDGYDYQNGAFHQRQIQYMSKANELVFEKAKGNMESKFKNIKIYFHGFTDLKQVKANNATVKCSKEKFKLMNDIPQFDPIGKALNANLSNLPTITIGNSSSNISVKW